tara:strand:+ start:1026 stop:1184 length:159 start_codon:yes stop_codon:yes gene_type:complete
MGKCRFVKLNSETAKRATDAREKNKVKKTKKQIKAMEDDKKKRLKEFRSWFA